MQIHKEQRQAAGPGTYGMYLAEEVNLLHSVAAKIGGYLKKLAANDALLEREKGEFSESILVHCFSGPLPLSFNPIPAHTFFFVIVPFFQELLCLHRITSYKVGSGDTQMQEFLSRIAMEIKMSMQFPSVCDAQIVLRVGTKEELVVSSKCVY